MNAIKKECRAMAASLAHYGFRGIDANIGDGWGKRRSPTDAKRVSKVKRLTARANRRANKAAVAAAMETM